MKTDYDYYLLGCRYEGVKPLSRWRFGIIYGNNWRVRKQELARIASPERQSRTVLRRHFLQRTEQLVRLGKDYAARVGRFEDGEDGATGAGDREPRVPLTPVLVGCGARPLPRLDRDLFVERQL